MDFIICLLENLIFFPAALLCYLPMKNQLRFSRCATLLLVAPLLAGGLVILSFLEARPSPFTVGMELLVLLLFYLCYHFTLRIHISRSLGIFMTVVAFLSIFFNMALCLKTLYGLTDSVEDHLRYSLLFSGGGSLAALLLAYPAARYGSTMVDQRIPNDVWYAAVLLSAMLLAFNYQLRPLAETMRDNIRMTLFILSMCATQFLTWAVLQSAAYSISMGVKAGLEAKERNRLYEMQEHQFLSQQRYVEAAQKVLHDSRHNLRTLDELYRAGNYEALGDYLRQYAETLPIKEDTAYSSHSPLNALLNYYARTARREEISLEIRVSLPDKLPIGDVDLCAMIGNILENAVHAAARSKERRIRLDILTEGGWQLYIAATNSFDGHIRKLDGVYLSTAHSGSGIGLSSIAATAEKYGGVARFYHKGRTFYSDVAIPLTEDGKEGKT